MKKIRNAVIVTEYNNSKKVNQKAWNRFVYNKDGSGTKWGVNRAGHRYKQKFFSTDSIDKVEKIFNTYKTHNHGVKQSVTLYVRQYVGTFDKKKGRVTSGKESKAFVYGIDTKTRRVHKGKVYIKENNFDNLIRPELEAQKELYPV